MAYYYCRRCAEIYGIKFTAVDFPGAFNGEGLNKCFMCKELHAALTEIQKPVKQPPINTTSNVRNAINESSTA